MNLILELVKNDEIEDRLLAHITEYYLRYSYNANMIYYYNNQELKSMDLFLRFFRFIIPKYGIFLVPTECFESIDQIENLIKICDNYNNYTDEILKIVLNISYLYIYEPNWFDKLISLLCKHGTISTLYNFNNIYNWVVEIGNDEYKNFEYMTNAFNLLEKGNIINKIINEHLRLHNYKKNEMMFFVKQIAPIQDVERIIISFLLCKYERMVI